MTQEITLTLEESHVQFIRQQAAHKRTTVSKIVDDYLELLQQVDTAYQLENIHPTVAAVSGMVSTGRNETKKTIFD
jgi:hypothetical protein